MTFQLRDIANDLERRSDDLAHHFYNVHYAIPWELDELGSFDPYLPNLDGIVIEEFIESISIVLNEGREHLNDMIIAYLEAFRDANPKDASQSAPEVE